MLHELNINDDSGVRNSSISNVEYIKLEKLIHFMELVSGYLASDHDTLFCRLNRTRLSDPTRGECEQESTSDPLSEI